MANRTLSIVNHDRGRVVDVELWYPTGGAGNPQTILDFATGSIERDELADLLIRNSAALPENLQGRLDESRIGVVGNTFMRSNYAAAAGPGWKVEVADAGHCSCSDIAGIVPGFAAGCGDGERQTIPGEPLTYIDSRPARDITASYGTRFFAAHLLDDEMAPEELGESTHPEIVDVGAK